MLPTTETDSDMKYFRISLFFGMIGMLLFIIWLGDLSASDLFFILTTDTF